MHILVLSPVLLIKTKIYKLTNFVFIIYIIDSIHIKQIKEDFEKYIAIVVKFHVNPNVIKQKYNMLLEVKRLCVFYY